MHIPHHEINVLLQVMYIIILGRLGQFKSDINIGASCFSEHTVWLNMKIWLMFDVMHLLQVT